MHLVAPLREFSEANPDWLTVFQLPTYAPDLNSQEGMLVAGSSRWSGAGQKVIDSCLADTGLTLSV